MKKTYIFIALALIAQAVMAQNPARNAAQAKASALECGIFSHYVFGAAAVYDDGECIVGIDPDRMMNPASNMKVITTATALEALGADYRWETELFHSGEISDCGTLDGDLIIKGNGDPTLGADNSAEPIDETFRKWKSIIDKAGIRKINGSIVADGSWLEGMREDQTWAYEDLGTYYGTCLSGLNFYENRKDFRISAGADEGDSLSISEAYPPTPWMRWSFDCTTGRQGSGDQLYMYTEANGKTGVLRGSFAAGKADKTIHCRNDHPELTIASEFCKYLSSNGLEVMGEAREQAVEQDGSIMEIGRTKSVPLKDVVRWTNRTSDNFYAEMMFRTLGGETFGHSDGESSRKAMEQVVSKGFGLAADKERLFIQDGSGLSLRNRVSPSFMCGLLRAEMGKSHYGTLLESLVKYGERVYLKTGSFTGCRNLCGYILPSVPGGRTIIFSIMVNNSPLSTSQIETAEKSLIDTLAGMN